jgi:hypothetical protein
MYALFRRYYDQTSRTVFERDLNEKEKVFVVRERRTHRIIGFSTLRKLAVLVDARPIIGYFSGDTIVDRDHWGRNGLGTAFLWYLLREKIRRPLDPIYWVLTSKGYKTYLLLTNNLRTYYPRFDRGTPPFYQRLRDTFGRALYPDHYNDATGLVTFSKQGASKDRLASDVAAITPAMRSQVAAISFFERQNPRWADGDELLCIGEFSPMVLWSYLTKRLRKLVG